MRPDQYLRQYRHQKPKVFDGPEEKTDDDIDGYLFEGDTKFKTIQITNASGRYIGRLGKEYQKNLHLGKNRSIMETLNVNQLLSDIQKAIDKKMVFLAGT